MKEILFIAPSFYGYYKDIANEFDKLGYRVKWYDDQINQTYFIKFLRKVNKSRFEKIMDQYIDKVIDENRNEIFDFVILILGYDIPLYSIKKLLNTFSKATSVYYTWDSFSTYPQTLNFLDVFDRCYTFDRVEAKKYNIELLPLYFIKNDDFLNDKIYDYSTVMSYFPNKDKNLRSIVESLPYTPNVNLYLYVKSRLYFIYLKLSHPSISFKMNQMRYSKLSKKETIDIFKQSKAVIDSPIINQKGLTMRTFEVLSNNVKLITTNSDIMFYDFYCSNNIYVVNGEANVPDNFFDEPFDINYILDKKYSIECFAQTLLGFRKEGYLKNEN